MREDHLNVVQLNNMIKGLALSHPHLKCTLATMAQVIDREFYELAIQRGVR